jgi:NIPSNAP protein
MEQRLVRVGPVLRMLLAVGLIAVSLAVESVAGVEAAQAGRGAPPAPTPPCGPNLPATVKNVAKDSRCFELRTYTVQEGSSIDLLHSRFRDHTSALFRKHGMTIIGYWQPVARPNTLIYLLAYKDGAARDAAWAAFGADPEWVKTRTAMAVSVQVDSVFMSATDYSPLK